jgi:hypothetical protein
MRKILSDKMVLSRINSQRKSIENGVIIGSIENDRYLIVRKYLNIDYCWYLIADTEPPQKRGDMRSFTLCHDGKYFRIWDTLWDFRKRLHLHEAAIERIIMDDIILNG